MKLRRAMSWQTTHCSAEALVGWPVSFVPHSAVPGRAGSSACAMRNRRAPPTRSMTVEVSCTAGQEYPLRPAAYQAAMRTGAAAPGRANR